MEAIILFDGVCNFCDRSVNFVIEHDKYGYFKFAPLQSAEGKRLAQIFGFAAKEGSDKTAAGAAQIDSVILVESGKAYTQSTAALRVVKQLGLPWSLLYAFIIIPAVIRDYFYKLFARNRYRVFGKKEQCMTPPSDVRARFLT